MVSLGKAVPRRLEAGGSVDRRKHHEAVVNHRTCRVAAYHTRCRVAAGRMNFVQNCSCGAGHRWALGRRPGGGHTRAGARLGDCLWCHSNLGSLGEVGRAVSLGYPGPDKQGIITP